MDNEERLQVQGEEGSRDSGPGNVVYLPIVWGPPIVGWRIWWKPVAQAVKDSPKAEQKR